MTTETYVTQQKAAEILESHFLAHGTEPGRNLQYLLNDQRRGRYSETIPFLKVRGRILYRIPDIKEWADSQISKGATPHPGIFVVEGKTELERLAKLSSAITKH